MAQSSRKTRTKTYRHLERSNPARNGVTYFSIIETKAFSKLRLGRVDENDSGVPEWCRRAKQSVAIKVDNLHLIGRPDG